MCTKFTTKWLTLYSINEYEARGTNNIEYCPRMLHVADATQPGMLPITMYNIASKTLGPTSATPCVKLVQCIKP